MKSSFIKQYSKVRRLIKFKWMAYHDQIQRAIVGAAGLGFLSAAAWTFSLSLGLAVAGVSCFIIEWHVGEKK